MRIAMVNEVWECYEDGFKLYGSSSGVATSDGLSSGGVLYGRRVFCSDMTFDAMVNPVVYEGGEPLFIDSEYET